VSIVQNNASYKPAGEPSLGTNPTQLQKDVDNNKRDIDKFGVDLGQHLLDYKSFKEAVTRNMLD
jgi:hypothetical protein